MMKKHLMTCAILAAGMVASLCACSDEDKNVTTGGGADPLSVDYNSANARQWGNYMVAVATLLRMDAANLYDVWTGDTYKGGLNYAERFIRHDGNPYGGAGDCVLEILGGCIDIANEVGTQKIGQPYQLYQSGKTTEALYAVESWFSWHSIADYANNIRSIRNAYYGSLDGTIHRASLSALLAAKNADCDAELRRRIQAAIAAIESIPDPFRSHIVCRQSEDAMDACVALADYMEQTVKPYFEAHITDEAELNPAIVQYVNGVVVPTYTELKERNERLYQAVRAFQSAPSDAAFEACAEAWFNARTPWETSEAFLFGPVADEGLDPNMDSWPLDAAGITAILKSGKFQDLEWSGDYVAEPDEGSDDAASLSPEELAKAQKIANAQNLRGYHTLEFLIFKSGKARKVN